MSLHHRRGHRRHPAPDHHAATTHHDRAATPGRSTGVTAPPAPHAAPPSRTVTGHYVGEHCTAEVNQVERTIVGRLAPHFRARGGGDPLVEHYHVAAELAWDNAGSTGFRGTATRDGARGGSTRVTLVFSGTGHLHVELAHAQRWEVVDGIEIPTSDHYAFELDRRSAVPAASDATVASEGALDRVAETAALTVVAERAIERLLQTLRVDLQAFFGSSRELDHMAALSRVDVDVDAAVRSARLVPEQEALFAARVRQSLADHRLTIDGVTWSYLDWLTTAMARATTDAGHTAADRLGIPFGGAARAGAAMHTYELTFQELAGDVGPVGAHAGRVRIRELAGPACEHPWERTYYYAAGSITIGLSHDEGASLGGERTATATVPFAWRPEDFIGEIGGLEGEIGASASAGSHSGDLSASDGVLTIYGSGVYDPIVLHPRDTSTYGATAEIGASMELTEGRIGGLRDPSTRPDEATAPRTREVRVPADMDVLVAFDTDVTQLTPAGMRALRQVIAWNLELLSDPEVLVVVDAYASRAGTAEHNLGLAQRRQATVMAALAALVPGLGAHTLVAGEARGEEAAAEMGERDGDNAQYWRRAEVSINGTLCLNLFGTPAEDHVADAAEVMGDE